MKFISGHRFREQDGGMNALFFSQLIKHILNEFVLDSELVDKFNAIIEKDFRAGGWFLRKYNIQNLFDLIESYETHYYDDEDFVLKPHEYIDKELLDLNKVHRYLYVFDFNKNQKLEIFELIKNNEVAQNRLKEIAENHLESNYDFESLMQYLKKKEKKNLTNI